MDSDARDAERVSQHTETNIWYDVMHVEGVSSEVRTKYTCDNT